MNSSITEKQFRDLSNALNTYFAVPFPPPCHDELLAECRGILIYLDYTLAPIASRILGGEAPKSFRIQNYAPQFQYIENIESLIPEAIRAKWVPHKECSAKLKTIFQALASCHCQIIDESEIDDAIIISLDTLLKDTVRLVEEYKITLPERIPYQCIKIRIYFNNETHSQPFEGRTNLMIREKTGTHYGSVEHGSTKEEAFDATLLHLLEMINDLGDDFTKEDFMYCDISEF